MKLFDGLRTWWQEKTGEEETPFDGDTPVWLVSLVFHLALMFLLSFLTLNVEERQVSLMITDTVEEPEEELLVPEEFYFSNQPAVEVGANSEFGTQMALSQASIVSEVSDIPQPTEVEPTETEVAQIEIDDAIQVATGLHYNKNVVVRGAAGQGVTGATGAIDRITHEILLSLEERKTLVIWCFDQSPSMLRQREAVHDRFDRIYEELGVIEAAGNPAFAKHDDKPLLSTVVAFGQDVKLMIPKPTDNLAELKKAVAEAPTDNSGVEKVFSAVYMAANQYRGLRMPDSLSESHEPKRNVMIVVFTDEAGEDVTGLDDTVKLCRRYEIPVYVVGVPAPFGVKETLVKWVDPDPNFDQSPQWGSVDQGPESFLPERIKLSFSASGADEDPIDSGFGPFALTRLCVETGGIFFTVHPNRNVNREVTRNEIDEFSSHLKYFFDPQVMRKYRPDYVSADEYLRRINANKARRALVEAAKMSWLAPMESPTLRFVKSDEAAFVNALSEAQKNAAKLEPKVNSLFDVLDLGQGDRDKETIPRWQAGYDLAMGRVMAVKVRTEAYNAMLAAAKTSLKFKDPKNNTWVLEPADEVSVGSKMEKMAEKAKMYLQRIVKDHPDTPWALLAKKELENPVGWKWREEFTDLSPPREMPGNDNNNPPPPANDARRMLERPKPKRPPPKL